VVSGKVTDPADPTLDATVRAILADFPTPQGKPAKSR
jgi:hypothetical protein